ncbi:MAG: hypothetical protein VB138_03995 [Burkholderia sp.]
MKFQLIDEWREAHRFSSVRLSALMATVFAIGPSLLSAWAALPDDLKQVLPTGWARTIAVGAFLLVLLARVTTFEIKASDVDAAH